MAKAKVHNLSRKEDARSEIDRLTKMYLEESTLQSAAAKETLARLCAELVVRHRRLTELELDDKLTAEVARTLPGIASNIKRLMEELGLTANKKKDKPKASFV